MTGGATSPQLRWDAERLWQQLQPVLPGVDVEVWARCESTNTALLERARHAAEADTDAMVDPRFGRRQADLGGCLLVAEHQTRGRGRQGRPWQSAAGASLTFSLALPLAPCSWAGLSLAVGVALADALEPPRDGAGRIGLKWPNDLWLLDAPGQGRKLGGVLIETTPVGSQRLVVVGVGLNIAPQAQDGLNTGFACMQELDPAWTAPAALHRVAPPLAEALKCFERDGFGPFSARYAGRDLLASRPVRTTAPECPEGIACGVDDEGALRVRHAGGECRLGSGEVSVRLDGGC